MSNTDQKNVEVHLRDLQFDMKKVPFPTILLVAKRFAGKSWMSVAIAEQFKKPRWAAWCGTKDTEDFWAERFGSNATVRGPDDRGIRYLKKQIEYQQRKVRQYKKVLKLPFPRYLEVGFVFDDVTSKRKFRKGEMLEDLFSNGRHYKAAIIISCQYLKQLPPAVRGNTDYLFMMHNTKKNIKLLFDEYVEAESLEFFQALLKHVTNQTDQEGHKLHSALVFDNVQTSHDIGDQFKLYRHYDNFDVQNVLLGDETWRKFIAERHYDEETEQHIKEYKKKLKRQRIKTYRQRQLDKRQHPHAYHTFQNDNLELGLDLDDFSDSESETGETNQIHVQQKRGQTVTVNLPSGRRVVPTQNSFYVPLERKVTNPSVSSWSQQRQYLQQNRFIQPQRRSRQLMQSFI